MNRLLVFCAFLALIALLPIAAQDPAESRPDQDPGAAGPGQEYDPSRGVARISLLNGDVSVRRGDSGDVVAAALNAPLVSQDRVLTSSSSRTEIQFDNANMLRIGSNSEVRLNDVQQKRFQIQVAIGTISFRVLRNSQADVEIDTPSISFRPLGRGAYRVTVREDGSSDITVREGEAEIFNSAGGARGTERLRRGMTVLARGSANDPEFQEVAEIGLDDWDRWNESRDRQLESSRAYQYVSPDVTGAEDLEGYGRWVSDPGYGNVWVPRVEPGWAPYRSGRWVWEDFYGWTWVSYDPWGWAPYHYGRWYSSSYGWAWCPGSIYSHHYWSPALVAFFGFGGYGGFHSGIGFGFGNVGWVPLAPYERFHPWWGRGLYSGYGGGYGRGFINNTTIVNNTNITNIYRNARVNNGITAVGANDFGRHTGQFVGMNGASIRDAGLVRGVLPVTPDRSSLRLGDRQVRAGAFPQDRNINFAGRGGNPSAQRVPFDQQQRGMDQVARQTFGGGAQRNAGNSASGGNFTGRGFAGSGVSTQQPGSPSGFSQRGGSQPGVNGGAINHGWSRFGEPIHGSVPDASRPATQGQGYSSPNSGYGRGGYGSSNQQTQPPARSGADYSGGGWHRFGEPSVGNGGGSQAAPQGGGRYQSAPASRSPQSYSDGGSSGRFGGSGRYSAPVPSSNYQPYSQPAQQYSSPRYDYGRGNGNSQPVRISPPMVHERSMPSYGGGGGRSAPAYSGGGGGGAHSSSSGAGGGGGGRGGGNNGSSGGHSGGRR